MKSLKFRERSARSRILIPDIGITRIIHKKYHDSHTGDKILEKRRGNLKAAGE
jgi:hypothetical protein